MVVAGIRAGDANETGRLHSTRAGHDLCSRLIHFLEGRRKSANAMKIPKHVRDTFRERVARGDDCQTIIVEELFQSAAGKPPAWVVSLNLDDDDLYDLGQRLASEAEESLA